MKRAACVLTAVLLLFAFPFTGYAADGDDDGGMIDGLIDGFLNGLAGLFIPNESFFADFNADIQAAVDRKTGGLVSTFQSITNQFNQLKTSRAENSKIEMTMPDNLLYPGYRGVTVNMLEGIDSFAVWFRGLFSAFLVVITVIYCYRKAVSLFKGG